ncbi:MAG: hypothetical protein AB8C02_16715 [Halioglobus sp.]
MKHQDIEQSQAGLKDVQLAAYCFTGAVALGFVVYWVLQIQSVREMLALAYG